ncbi:hypothetical protein Tco_1507458 [Tanacetum coccineum]
MSNSNTNLQTQSSNALHNAIMEAGSKDRPPMLAPGESINVQDLETNLYWEFGKFTSWDGESLDSELLTVLQDDENEIVRNLCHVYLSSSDVQFILQITNRNGKRFVTLLSRGQELMTVSYHKLYEF